MAKFTSEGPVITLTPERAYDQTRPTPRNGGKNHIRGPVIKLAPYKACGHWERPVMNLTPDGACDQNSHQTKPVIKLTSDGLTPVAACDQLTPQTGLTPDGSVIKATPQSGRVTYHQIHASAKRKTANLCHQIHARGPVINRRLEGDCDHAL